MRRNSVIVLLCFAAAVTGCDRKQPREPAAPSSPTAESMPAPPPTARAIPQQLPALYAGILPCADCEGIRYEVDLRPDEVFVARMTYLGKPAKPFDEIGQWTIADDNKLYLRGAAAEPTIFAIPDVSTLRKLDLQGHEIQSQLNWDLARQQSYAPLEPRLQLRGMYSYMADAGRFEECLTGLKLDVAMEEDNAALEAAYGKVRREPGQAVLVDLEGRIVKRPGMDDEQLRDTLIVEKTGRFWPNENCGARGVTHDLEGTRWVLVRLGENTVTPGAGQREPYLALESVEHRVSGYGGCNRLIGSYELAGEQLTFKQMALTRMACPNMQHEQAFAQALEATRTWQITGAHLELFDANGMQVARLESRNL